jgi:hypothetical protein
VVVASLRRGGEERWKSVGVAAVVLHGGNEKEKGVSFRGFLLDARAAPAPATLGGDCYAPLFYPLDH